LQQKKSAPNPSYYKFLHFYEILNAVHSAIHERYLFQKSKYPPVELVVLGKSA